MRTSRRLEFLIAFLFLLLWAGGGSGCNCGNDVCNAPGDHYCKSSFTHSGEVRDIYLRCEQGNCLPDGGSDMSCLHAIWIYCGSGVGGEACPSGSACTGYECVCQ